MLGTEFGVIFDVSLLPPTASTPVYRMYNSWRSGPKGEDIDAIGYCTSKDGLSWPGQPCSHHSNRPLSLPVHADADA